MGDVGALIEPSLFTPLAANRGYTSNITDEDRCQSCARKNNNKESNNYSMQLLERRSGKQRHMFHPHRDILGIDSFEENSKKAARKASHIKNFLPDISDARDSIVSPKSSAMARKVANNSDIVQRVLPPNKSKDKLSKQHHHYHIHTHHHYPKGVNGGRKTESTSMIGTENPWRRKSQKSKDSASGNRPKTARVGTSRGIQSRGLSTSDSNTVRNVQSIDPSIALPNIKDNPIEQERPKTCNASTNTRKNSKKGSRSNKPVSGKRKLSNPVRKITPPKRKTAHISQRKITPPKKLSDSSVPVTSTNLPTTKMKTTKSVQTNKPSTLHKPRLRDQSVPKRPLTAATIARVKSSKDRLKVSPPAQNFVVHSPQQTSDNLFDRIRASRERKGYPYLPQEFPDDDNDSNVHVYIAPHAPTGSKTYEDIEPHPPRQKWFQRPDEGRSQSSPNSPLRQGRSDDFR